MTRAPLAAQRPRGARGRRLRRRPGESSRRGKARLVFRAAVALAGLALGAGCLGGDAARERPDGTAEQPGVAPELRFEGSAPSLDALGRHVIAALTRGDTAGLREVRLTEAEHNVVVWPELPASRPAINFPVDFAWANIENRNRRGLDRTLPLYRGSGARFEGVRCRGATETFTTFAVHTDCWVAFSLAGREGAYEAQIFKDVLARGGGYKIFRYYDEEPRRPDGGNGS